MASCDHDASSVSFQRGRIFFGAFRDSVIGRAVYGGKIDRRRGGRPAHHGDDGEVHIPQHIFLRQAADVGVVICQGAYIIVGYAASSETSAYPASYANISVNRRCFILYVAGDSRRHTDVISPFRS